MLLVPAMERRRGMVPGTRERRRGSARRNSMNGSGWRSCGSMKARGRRTPTGIKVADPGSRMDKKSGSVRFRDDQPGSYFREIRKHFFGLKYLNSLMRVRDPG